MLWSITFSSKEKQLEGTVDTRGREIIILTPRHVLTTISRFQELFRTYGGRIERARGILHSQLVQEKVIDTIDGLLQLANLNIVSNGHRRAISAMPRRRL